MNFTYRLKKPIDNGWGSRDENGTWTGMVGSLVRKECDAGKKCLYRVYQHRVGHFQVFEFPGRKQEKLCIFCKEKAGEPIYAGT